MKVLVQFSADYADEFDVYGFAIMDKTKWEEHVKDVTENAVWPQSRSFGTNEGVEWADSDDYFRAFTAKDITSAEEITITSLFDLTYNYGHFLKLDEYSEVSELW